MLKEILEKYEDEELIIMNGYDNCIVGVGESCNQPPRIIYSVERILKQLIEQDGMSYDEASEWFEFNQLGAYVGEKTPIFLFTPIDQ